jgi:hypothetical protein
MRLISLNWRVWSWVRPGIRTPPATATTSYRLARYVRRSDANLLYAFGAFAAVNVSSEIVFQDFFTQPAGTISNSVPWIDVHGDGWQAGGAASQFSMDGQGHLYNGAASGGAAAGVQLVPIGPHGSMTASAWMRLPVGSTEWIGLGFGNSNEFLTSASSGSGPWVQVQGTGTIALVGGAGLNNRVPVANAFTNNGEPVQVFLTYDAFHATASAGTVSGGTTNLVSNQWPIANTASSITAKYLLLQFSTNLTTATARWASGLAVDWIPRPPPMLSLPVPILNTVEVGSPSGNDAELIQKALTLAAHVTNTTEIRFLAGATYVITNDSLIASIPLSLTRATNVLVNGNGCQILITNPRIGFLSVNSCSNIIVQGFTVDHDPLPFTQGVVTHNFYTEGDADKEAAIEFTVDAGYPAPTNANYLDPNAARWGMVMDPAQPGRVANGAYTQCFYINVTQTNRSGAFKVHLSSSAQAETIQPGDLWCMISRWDGSILFNTFQSYQVTYLNNTSYTAAGATYVGIRSPLINEINDAIQFGPPPAQATAPRRRTSNSDGGLFIESRIGPWVQGCHFSGLSDDTANACLGPFISTNVPAYPTNTFAVFVHTRSDGTPAGLAASQAAVGDSVGFFNATNGIVFDHATVTAVDLPNLTFDHAIANVVPGTYDNNTLLLNETLNTSAAYLDNQFSNSGFHGIYCRAHNMLLAHNTVSGMGKNAICAFPAMTRNFLNFFVPTNVVIMDNVLSDGGFSYEAIHNAIPTEQPSYALVEMHKADLNSNYVTNGLDVSGIRILHNAFLNWRRAPLSLHNATDVNVIGNYFGPPLTNDGLVALTNDVLAELWASDYANLRFKNNVNATILLDNLAINEDGIPTSIAEAFQPPAAPRLLAALDGNNVVVSWMSPAPGFVLQQAAGLVSGTNEWVDVGNSPWLDGESNVVNLARTGAVTSQFFRARQR